MHSGWEGLYALTMEGLFLPDGFANMVPSAVEILGVTADDHTVTVDMNDAFLAGSGSGLLGDFTMLNQLIYTTTAQGGFESVLFTVNGEPVTAFGSEGLDLSEPQGQDAYLDQLNSVNVDSPAQGQGDEPLVIAGFANVFEATVSLEVVDSSGNVVQEDFTTATCGTGCWGAYEFEVDYPFVGGETIRVFWHSAEDGSPSDVVSIPVLWDDPDGWDFTSARRRGVPICRASRIRGALHDVRPICRAVVPRARSCCPRRSQHQPNFPFSSSMVSSSTRTPSSRSLARSSSRPSTR